MQTRANAFKFRLPGSIQIMTAKSYVKNRFLLLLKKINFPILVTASCALLRNLCEQSLWSDIYEGRDWNKSSFVTDTTQNLMLDRLKWYLKWWQICRLSRPTISCCSLSEDFSSPLHWDFNLSKWHISGASRVSSGTGRYRMDKLVKT